MTTRKEVDLAGLRVWFPVYTLAAGFFVGMEWLFFITKPSFLSVFHWGECLRVFGATLLPLLAAGIVVLLALWGIARLMPVRVVLIACGWSMRALPTLVLAASALLLVDNFTTTLFDWSIATLRRGQLPYAAVAMLGVVLVWRLVGRLAAALRADARARRLASAVAASIIALAGAAAALEAASVALTTSHVSGRPTRRPDILLIGLDGVNADHLSLYGYERQTTPFLTELAREAMVFTNAYSNAGNTGGALTAILTGRLPTDTRVIFAPDILRGESAVLHLPAILRAVGYRTGQFVIRHYAASIDFNMRGGFDVVNGRAVDPQAVATRALLTLGLGGYFLDQIAARVRTRVERLAGHRERSALEEVNEPLVAQYMDASRIRQLVAFVEEAPAPWFAHVHLMVTHGDRFAPRQQRFSAGQEQTTEWMPNFYDDAILDADRSVNEVVTRLRQRGTFERTLIIIYSDHAQGFRTDRPLPLLVRVPGALRGRKGQTVQSIDIAPTILDVLGLRAPPWMTGQSLLRGVPPCRAVFGTMATARHRNEQRGDYTIPEPPFFSLGVVSLVQGRRWYFLQLDEAAPRISGGVIPVLPGAVADCAPVTAEQAQRLLVNHLRAARYEVPEPYLRQN
jgi:arylsulfatase A-like enzyme